MPVSSSRPEEHVVFMPEFAIKPEDFIWFFFLLVLLISVAIVSALIVNKYFKEKFVKILSYVISAIFYQFFARFIMGFLDLNISFQFGFPFKIISWDWDGNFYIVGLILNIIFFAIVYFLTDKLVRSKFHSNLESENQNNSIVKGKIQ